MPMLLVRLDEHAVARADDLDRSIATLHEAYAFGHPERLAAGVTMPRGSCARGEMNDARAEPRTVRRCGNRVDKDVASEPVRWPAVRVCRPRDLHVRLLTPSSAPR